MKNFWYCFRIHLKTTHFCLRKDLDVILKKWNLFLQVKKNATLLQFQAEFLLILVFRMSKKMQILLSDMQNMLCITLKNVVKIKLFNSLKLISNINFNEKVLIKRGRSQRLRPLFIYLKSKLLSYNAENFFQTKFV